MTELSPRFKKLDDLMNKRLDNHKEAYKAWSELRAYITPLLTKDQDALIHKLDMHFLLMPLEDAAFVVATSTTMFMATTDISNLMKKPSEEEKYRG